MSLGESVLHWTQNWVVDNVAFAPPRLISGSVLILAFIFFFTFFSLLPRCGVFFFTVGSLCFYTLLSSLFALPREEGVGNLAWAFLGKGFGEKKKRPWVV
ncbi:hypothetical protein V8C37DRAFT_382729 [Trichoderma ceciliae]